MDVWDTIEASVLRVIDRSQGKGSPGSWRLQRLRRNEEGKTS